MIIKNIQMSHTDSHTRIQADLVWEENGKSHKTLWYETDNTTADGFTLSADPFLLAGYTLSVLDKETRCHVDGHPVCPYLADQLPGLARSLFERGRGFHHYPSISSSEGYVVTTPPEPRVAANYLSGGVDAMALLYRNITSFEPSHPERFKESLCIFGLYGFDCPNGNVDPDRLKAWQALRDRMSHLCNDADIQVVSAYTNLRSFVPDFKIWSKHAFFPLHASVAHAFKHRWESVTIASDGLWEGGHWDYANGLPGIASSSAMVFQTDSPLRTRQERILEIVQWPRGLAVLQPCAWVDLPRDQQVNCGKCEKCVRTMLGLLIAGHLQNAPFPHDITPAMIKNLNLKANPLKLVFLKQFIPALQEMQRHELVKAILQLGKK